MKKVKARAVIIHGPDGYMLHGSHDQTPTSMFETLSSVWKLNPERETVHYVEVEILLPEYSLTIEEPTKDEHYPDKYYGWEKITE